LALQIDPAAGARREAVGQVERRRPADEVAVEQSQSLVEGGVVTRLGPGLGQLVERGDQRLRHIAPPVGPEPLLDRAHAGVTLAPLAASKKAAIAAWSLRPGSASTPLATSTAKGC